MTTKFSDINLREVGQTIQMVGAVYAGNDSDSVYFLPFPAEADNIGDLWRSVQTVKMSHEEWKLFLRQADLVETEVLAEAKDGTLYKALIRKCTRQIDSQVSWNVFRRDNFTCRYCGAEDRPLTVDHLVRWEDGGPTIEANLVACCRRCNKVRGDTPYAVWLRHPYYLDNCTRLSIAVQNRNIEVADTLANIPRKPVVRDR